MSLDLAEPLSEFEALIDPKTGVIQSVSLVKSSEIDPDVFVAYASPCDTEALTGLKAANRGAASSPVKERAVLRACGESVERYCSAIFAMGELRIATMDELAREGSRFVDVRDLYPFADEQYALREFPYERPDAKPLRWTCGRSIIDDGDVWLPASCVYVPYLFDRAVEPFTHMPISTGLAAGRSVESCIQKGLLEILERDALMIVWSARLLAPRLEVKTCAGLSPVVDALLDVKRTGAAWHLNWLTLDVDIPIVSAALIDPADPPRTSFGIAADPDPVRAVMLALEEATLTRVLVNQTLDSEGDFDEDEIRTLRDHMLVHARSSDLRARLGFLEEGQMRSFDDLSGGARRDDAPGVVECVAEAGFEPSWVDITSEDIAQFGFRVVRTVIPGMQPLDNDHRYRYLGGPRIFSVPPALGFPGVTLDSLNPDPHPFP
ncbi:MAG: YcaO-like family protein [Actinomycetota bacterium]|nr:YcaO-like family protein [Actinomycetota bacterium]